jgi:FliI/YscN family ATPase
MELHWDRVDRVLRDTPTLLLSGRVTRVAGLLVEAQLQGAKLGMTCRIMIPEKEDGVLAEVVAFRDGIVSLMPLSTVTGIQLGTPVEPLSHEPTIGVSDSVLGRVLDGWGHPIDQGPPIYPTDRVPLHPAPLNPMLRGVITEPLSVGVKAIDGALTCGQGQRLAIMAGAGVGKSTLLGMMARNTNADVTVLALVGERSREVKRFVETELGATGLQRTVVVASTSNTVVALRLRAAYLAMSIAEYYRDQGLRVLFLLDSLTRVCMAQRELGLAIGEPPTTRGYPPSSFSLIPAILERAGPGVNGGSITALYTVLLEGDDMGDPIGDAVRAVTDGHIVLSRKLAEQGHFPAIDVLASTSRVMTEVVSEAHQQASTTLRRILADLREAEEMQTFGAYRPGEVARFDLAMSVAKDVRQFLCQETFKAQDYVKVQEQLLELGAHIAELEAGGI